LLKMGLVYIVSKCEDRVHITMKYRSKEPHRFSTSIKISRKSEK
jgi:hypothetical protein